MCLISWPTLASFRMVFCRELKLEFWNFKSIFCRIQFSLVATFFSTFGYLFELKFAFKIKRRKCKSILHTWNWLPDILESKWSFQTIKRSLSDSFGATYKCKVSSYMDNAKVLLSRLNAKVLLSRLNLGFNLNYFSSLL